MSFPAIICDSLYAALRISPAASDKASTPLRRSRLLLLRQINLLRKYAPLLGAVLCTGCTSIHTRTPEGESVFMNEADFAAYFEHVFRHHNNVVNESLYVTPGRLGSGDDPVSRAETRMDHACQPLNEAASAGATGQPLDFWTKMKLNDAVPECEAATRKLEKLLSEDK